MAAMFAKLSAFISRVIRHAYDNSNVDLGIDSIHYLLKQPILNPPQIDLLPP